MNDNSRKAERDSSASLLGTDFLKGNHLQPTDLLIPLILDKEDHVTRVFVVGNEEFPHGGQRNLLDISGDQLRESIAGLSIQRGMLDQSLQKGYITTLMRLADSIDNCDRHTRCHSLRTSYWARNLAMEINLPAAVIAEISLAARLHDVGKILVPRKILVKPERLNDDEWNMMKHHPTYGAFLMEPSEQLRSMLDGVRAHHEHWDGSGYPDGLATEKIPLSGRIIALADAYTTITEGRVYRKARPIQAALEEIRACSGTQFDPYLVDVFSFMMERLQNENQIPCAYE